ncbi:MAG: hypothetical protein FD141_235 [Fusobacteria bacterium]|nr:MAG: hypothetical protein FD141_235 [Fusobacteriota bacterium]KAF0229101.1 MAG: hypothetical protein FD182_1357 [Fusobacteriota bacterium]
MKKKVVYVILGFLSLLQILGGFGIFFLDDLSGKKVGVNHHVIIKKKEFISTWMSNNQVDVYKLVLLFIVVLASCYLVYQIFKRENWWRYVSTFLVILFGILIYCELILEVFQELPVYMYLVYMSVGILFIEILKVVIQKLMDIEIFK